MNFFGTTCALVLSVLLVHLVPNVTSATTQSPGVTSADDATTASNLATNSNDGTTAAGAGAAVTGGSVTGAAVTGAAVTGAAVTGGSVTGAAVTGAAVTGAAVTGGDVTTAAGILSGNDTTTSSGADNSTANTTAAPTTTLAPIECYSCSNTGNSSNCDTPSANDTCTSTNNVCFTLFNVTSGVLSRACSFGNVNDCTMNQVSFTSDQCAYCCTGDKCNSQTINMQQCMSDMNSGSLTQASHYLLFTALVLVFNQRFFA